MCYVEPYLLAEYVCGKHNIFVVNLELDLLRQTLHVFCDIDTFEGVS